MKQSAIILLGICLSAQLTQLSGQGVYKSYNHTNYKTNPDFKQEITPQNFDPERLSAAIYFATNEIRAKKRLGILPYNPKLAKAARMHSDQMAKKGFFSHTNRKNKKLREPDDRAKASGIKNPKLAENIIEGFLIRYTSGEKVVAAGEGKFKRQGSTKYIPPHTYLSLTGTLLKNWMKSPGHKANILSKNAVELGCGSAMYFMENFNQMPAVKVTQNFQWFEKSK